VVWRWHDESMTETADNVEGNRGAAGEAEGGGTKDGWWRCVSIPISDDA
jgi:hypothetical protein